MAIVFEAANVDRAQSGLDLSASGVLTFRNDGTKQISSSSFRFRIPAFNSRLPNGRVCVKTNAPIEFSELLRGGTRRADRSAAQRR